MTDPVRNIKMKDGDPEDSGNGKLPIKKGTSGAFFVI